MLVNEFNKMIRHEQPDEKLFVPLFKWVSGKERDIELAQKINKRFEIGVPIPVLNRQLALNTTVHFMFKYPKILKNEKIKFFYDDICRYFNWTLTELRKNMDVIDLEEMKPIIARAYGHDNKMRRAIGLKAIKGFRRFEA